MHTCDSHGKSEHGMGLQMEDAVEFLWLLHGEEDELIERENPHSSEVGRRVFALQVRNYSSSVQTSQNSTLMC